MEQSMTKINLWDMLWEVLLKWRSILLVSIIMTMLFGVGTYMKSVKQIESQQNAQSVTIDNYAIDPVAKYRAKSYIMHETMTQKQSDYLLNSPLMKLDPNQLYVGSVRYFVQTDEGDARAICNAYEMQIQNQEMYDAISSQLGLTKEQSAYASELMDVNARFCTYAYENSQANETALDAEQFVTVNVYCDNKSDCEALTKLVDAQIFSEQSAVTAVFGKHDIAEVSSDVNCISSKELLEFQTQFAKDAGTVMTNFAVLKRDMSDTERGYIRLYKNQSVESEGEVQLKPGINKKMVMVGFLLGFVLMICVYAVGYVINTKIRLEDSLEKMFDAPVIGQVVLENGKKKKLFGFVDTLFLKMRHLYMHIFAQDAAIEMAAANIGVLCQNAGIAEIYVSGSEMTKPVCEVVELLKKQLDIKVIVGGSVIYNAEAMKQAAAVGTVLFVEQIGKTLYREVREGLSVCDGNGINVLGIVTVSA